MNTEKLGFRNSKNYLLKRKIVSTYSFVKFIMDHNFIMWEKSVKFLI